MSNGDPGKLLDNDGRRGEDAAMVRRAVKERWPIPDAKRKALMERFIDIALTEKPSDANTAFRTLVTADGQNQADEHLDEKNKRMDDGKPTDTGKITVEYVNRLPPPEAA